MEMMTSWRWGIMQRRHPSWSDFKAKPHKPHSCFICFPSHWACTLKASLIPCVSWWRTMPSFLKGSLFSVLVLFLSTQTNICEAVDNLIQSAIVPKIHILAWFPPLAFKPPTLPAKYTENADWTSTLLELHGVTLRLSLIGFPHRETLSWV